MASQPSQIRVMIVDDDAMSRDLLSVLLEGRGFHVESAESGDAALAHLKRSRTKPHVMLTDVQMPGISGAQLADKLRQACGPAALLLAMSGSGPDNEAISRFDGFLLKPFAIEEVMAAISARGKAAPAPRRASKSRMEGRKSQPAVAEVDEIKNGSPTLDERIYKQLNDAMPGQQLQQMYAMCVKDARDRIAAMRGLAAEHNGAQFIREAHAIKGGCGMLGATEIYGMAAHLETSGLDAAGLEGTQGVNPLDELIAACDRLERILGSRV